MKNHKQFWVMVASYYRVTLPDITLEMYAQDTRDIPLETMVSIFETYRRTTKSPVLPMPIVFREIYEKKMSADVQANLVPQRIFEAISKFGWAEPDKAREYIGELGWRLVEMRGGWLNVCQNLGTNWDEGTFIAQARDNTKSLIKAAELGYGDKPIDLPSSHNAQGQIEHDSTRKLISSVTKELK